MATPELILTSLLLIINSGLIITIAMQRTTITKYKQRVTSNMKALKQAERHMQHMSRANKLKQPKTNVHNIA